MDNVRQFLEGAGDVAGLLAACVILLAVAWIGVREGRGQVYAGQLRTLAELRATVQRLSRIIVSMSRSGDYFGPGFLDEWDALQRGLRDLLPPARRRKKADPGADGNAVKQLEAGKRRKEPPADL